MKSPPALIYLPITSPRCVPAHSFEYEACDTDGHRYIRVVWCWCNMLVATRSTASTFSNELRVKPRVRVWGSGGRGFNFNNAKPATRTGFVSSCCVYVISCLVFSKQVP